MNNRRVKLESGRTVTVTPDDVLSILSDAGYAVGYWCDEMHLSKLAYNRVKELMRNEGTYVSGQTTVEEIQTRALWEKYGIEFWYSEPVEDDDDHRIMDLEDLLTGIQLYLTELDKDGTLAEKLEYSDWDGEDADSVIQYACFGEVVFG